MSPPVISSSRMKRGRMLRLTPMQRTMFSWLNLLQRQTVTKIWVSKCAICVWCALQYYKIDDAHLDKCILNLLAINGSLWMIILWSNHKTISSFNHPVSEILRHTGTELSAWYKFWAKKSGFVACSVRNILSDFSEFKILFPIALADSEECDNDNVKRDLSTSFFCWQA